MKTQDPEQLAQRREQLNRRTLRVLLVVSFLNTGSWLLSHLGLALSGDTMREALMASYRTLAEHNPIFETSTIMMERFFSVPQWYYLLCVLLEAASVAGLILMWRIRKNGFHCYTLSKLLLMLLPLLFLDRSFISIGDMMIAILCIIYYFFLMKALGAFSAGPDNPAGPDETLLNPPAGREADPPED